MSRWLHCTLVHENETQAILNAPRGPRFSILNFTLALDPHDAAIAKPIGQRRIAYRGELC